MKKKITIKDIAKSASVSETTVSRFLNGKFEYMADDTRERIDKVIKELNYRPSNIARSLKSNKTKLFGAIIADIENPFSSLIIEGLINRVDELDYTLMISITNNSIEKEKEVIDTFLDHGVDGLVIHSVSNTVSYLEEISQEVPIVLIDRKVKNFETDTVTTNNYEVGSQLMTHLVGSGFKSISFVSETIKNNDVRETRYQAFLDNVEDTEINHSTILIDRNNTREIEENIEEFMTLPKPRVLVASNGLVQLALLEVLKKENYKMDKDFYLCGFDNYSWSSMIGKKGITTISQDSYQLGAEAVNILYNRVNNKYKDENPVHKVIESELIIRGTALND